MHIIESNIISDKSKIAIVVSRVNRFINNNLLEGAIDILNRVGNVQNKNITVVWVPGAYELPLIVKVLAVKKKYDALIALGTIIRGVTMHFEFILKSCNYSLSTIAIDNALPIGLGLLVADDIGQAIERSGIKNSNKGSEAALAALEMINILKIIDKTD